LIERPALPGAAPWRPSEFWSGTRAMTPTNFRRKQMIAA
jgi:hypothetical protein